MEITTYQTTFENENRYWWHAARREIALYLRQRLSRTANPTILNIGCGTGALSLELGRHGKVISLDLEEEALQFCQKQKLLRLVQADGQKLPLQDGTCDEIYALDVLEHFEKDEQGLREIYRCLKPKSGLAILTVPAYPFLWSRMDALSHHHRRYQIKEFRRLINQMGFSIIRLSHYNFFLFPFAMIFKLLQKKSKQNNKEAFIPPLPGWINLLFKKIFSAEKYFLRRFGFPVGVSILAVIRKS